VLLPVIFVSLIYRLIRIGYHLLAIMDFGNCEWDIVTPSWKVDEDASIISPSI
jgi:hypothetical protein